MENPNIKVNYFLNQDVPDLLVVYEERMINEIPKWKPISINSDKYHEVDNLFSEAVRLWRGEHERWTFTLAMQGDWNDYGGQLIPPRSGLEVFLDAMMPLPPNWDESPQSGWILQSAPPEIRIVEF